MGLHFYKSYQNGVARFQDFGGQKIQVVRDLKIVYTTLSLTNVSVHFRMSKLKSFIR